MKVTVKSILDIREILGGKRTIETEMKNNANVFDLLQHLVCIYGESFRNRVFDKEGNQKAEIVLFINGTAILALDGLETHLKPGDELLIFPPVGGG